MNGPEERADVIEIRGYTFDMSTGEVTSKFGLFMDPHDIAVTSDGKEVKSLNSLTSDLMNFKYF